MGMSYRRAWLLVEEINASLQQPAVTAAIGGRQGGGAALTPIGERVIELYRSIEAILSRPEVKENLAKQMLTVTLASPQEFTEFVRKETTAWGDFLRESKIKVE